MYDKDKDRILELVNLGVPVKKIIDTHLKYGKYQSLLKYINKFLPNKTTIKAINSGENSNTTKTDLSGLKRMLMK
jgi:hypothetical protein